MTVLALFFAIPAHASDVPAIVLPGLYWAGWVAADAVSTEQALRVPGSHESNPAGVSGALAIEGVGFYALDLGAQRMARGGGILRAAPWIVRIGGGWAIGRAVLSNRRVAGR